MMQFRKGDRVRIKSKEQLAQENDITIGEEFYSADDLWFPSVMWDGCGREGILKEQPEDNQRWWRFEADSAPLQMIGYLWEEDWFELAESPVPLTSTDLEGLL